jgi:hypothetical protein
MASDELMDLLYDLSSVGLDSIDPGKFDHINVTDIHPEPKDMKRAKDLAKLPKGIDAGGPLQNKANPQAKAITNSTKLIRRAKAVIAVWGTGEHETVKGTSNPWIPFKEKMIREGFRAEQVDQVANYQMPSWLY